MRKESEPETETDYVQENKRRRKSVDKENDFLKDRLIDKESKDETPIEDIPKQNQQTQIERKRPES